MKIYKQNKINWWMVTLYHKEMQENQFEVLKNMNYDKEKRLKTRWWLKSFWTAAPNNKPFTSIFFFQNDSTFERNLFWVAWDIFYKYDEEKNSWKSIKTWLLEFEKDWVTRTRWSFVVYKNILYMCDWVNNYASYDGKNYTEHTNQPKYRYLRYMNDTIFWASDDENPSTLYWSSPASENWNDLTQNMVVVGWDELWKINWIKDLWQAVLVFKNKKIYSVDILNKNSISIDAQNGWYSHRSIDWVWRSLFYQSDRWIDNLQNREQTTWIAWLESLSQTKNLSKITDKIKNKSLNNSLWYYVSEFANYYYSFDVSWDSIADTTLVYSALNNAWTTYDLPSFYDFWFYIDKFWEYHHLIAPDNNWQLFEIEKGYSDNWKAIECELKTKKYDFADSSLLKTFQQVDVSWLKSKKWKINLEIFVNWDLVQSAEIWDDLIIDFSEKILLWNKSIWKNTLNSSFKNETELELYRYVARLPLYETWTDIQIKMSSNEENFVWTYEGCNIWFDAESFELFDSRFSL